MRGVDGRPVAAGAGGLGVGADKAAWRRQLLAERRSLTESQRTAAAQGLAFQLIAWDRYEGARRIGAYQPMGAEIAPPLDPRTSWPVIDPPAFMPDSIDELDILLLPVVGVSLDGTRLGRGGGWYDQLLAACRHRPFLVAVAYDFQVVDALPCDPWDVPVDAICTPTQLVMIGRSSTG